MADKKDLKKFKNGIRLEPSAAPANPDKGTTYIDTTGDLQIHNGTQFQPATSNIGCVYWDLTGLTIDTSTEKMLTWDTVKSDPDSLLDATGFFTAPVTGNYLINCQIMYDAHTWTTGEVIYLDLFSGHLVGAGTLLHRTVPYEGLTELGSVQAGLNLNTVLTLTAGDKFHASTFQSGSSLDLVSGSPSAHYQSLSIIKL